MNLRNLDRDEVAPSPPILRMLQGRVPLARLSQRSSDARTHEPSFEFVVYDDGTVVYEGARCVRAGGLIITRMKADDIDGLREFLKRSCVGLQSPISNEVCIERPTVLQVTCSNGHKSLSATDRCGGDSASNVTVAVLAGELLKRVGAAEWLGEPTDRQACGAGASSLTPFQRNSL